MPRVLRCLVLSRADDGTAKLIDEEIRRLIDEAGATARAILEEHRDDLVTLGEVLLEYETLTGDEVKAVLRGESIVRPEEDEAPKGPGSRASVPASGRKAKEHPGPLKTAPQPES